MCKVPYVNMVIWLLNYRIVGLEGLHCGIFMIMYCLHDVSYTSHNLSHTLHSTTRNKYNLGWLMGIELYL